MFQFFSKLFSTTEGTNCQTLRIPKVKKVGPTEIAALRNIVIKSDMYLHYYERSKPYKVFQLPENKKLYFIRDSQMVHELIALETVEENNYTSRKQRYRYNQSLLNHNPVSSASLTSDSYVKDQHKLFVSLVMGIDNTINQINFQNSYSTIKGRDIIPFVIGCVAQCYLPMLLNVSAERVPLVHGDFCQLLDILEAATGKHNITFGDYLDTENCQYDDQFEQQYLPLFHRFVMQLKGVDSKLSEACDHEAICKEILEVLTPDCNILKVLLTQFDYNTESVMIVNNILSWMDNMLNVVHTVINFLVIIGSSSSPFNRDFYQENLPKARALATMFMRHVVNEFDVTTSDGKTVHFNPQDIIMMSNGNNDTVFGGKGRTCPSRPWSYIFVEKMVKFLVGHYDIANEGTNRVDPENDSWFWNKLSPQGLNLSRH